ncbi:MAG: hypothetical protein ABI972_28060, partial [Acidobacteriota bacterium]
MASPLANKLFVPFSGALVFGAVLCSSIYIAKSQQNGASLTIESLPSFGSFEDLSGMVLGAPQNSAKVLTYIFLPDLGWYQRPSCGAAASPNNLGVWSSDITTGPIDETATKVAAYLVPVGFQPECVQAAESIPFAIDRIAIAKDLYERPNPTPRTVRFGNQEWVIKSSRIPVYPGPKTPNFFVEDSRNVFVDPQGRLHLRITRCGDAWCSSEIYTRARIGFGSYRVQLDTPVNGLDSNVVLGLFTWSEDSTFAHREIDIEFAKWGNVGDRNTAQYVVQPYDMAGHLFRFPITIFEPTSHTIQWLNGSVAISSSARGTGASLAQWVFPNPSLSPPAGDVRFHINFYLNNATPPTDRQEKEIVLSAFDYVPFGPNMGFDETVRNIGAEAGSANFSISSSDQSCAWT